MIGVLAAVRPDDQNFPLFVHVLGAMILVGGLLTTAGALAWARGDVGSLRLGYRALLAVALPGWIVMRIGAQWIYSEEGWDDIPDSAEPTWLRPRRADPAGLAHRRRHRRLSPARGKGFRPAESHADSLAHSPGGLPGRGVGDGRQARLTLAHRDAR